MKEKWNLADAGFEYNIVAVFGSQSTGKSKYKLNKFYYYFQLWNLN